MKKNIKNTKRGGVLHFRIFKWNGVYVGICKETGFVEEATSFNIVKDKLTSGVVLLLKAVNSSKRDLEPSLNTNPPFKYLLCYHFAPIISWIESLKDTTKSGGFYSFSTSI